MSVPAYVLPGIVVSPALVNAASIPMKIWSGATTITPTSPSNAETSNAEM